MTFYRYISHHSSDYNAALAAWESLQCYQAAFAWRLYCEDTSGDLDAIDSWETLSPEVQKTYIEKATKFASEIKG